MKKIICIIFISYCIVKRFQQIFRFLCFPSVKCPPDKQPGGRYFFLISNFFSDAMLMIHSLESKRKKRLEKSKLRPKLFIKTINCFPLNKIIISCNVWKIYYLDMLQIFNKTTNQEVYFHISKGNKEKTKNKYPTNKDELESFFCAVKMQPWLSLNNMHKH